ncbi:hypothetical protein G9U51_12440 [Calidifontibacter sp. DB0510]|uniref:Aminoacyl-transfer RNA synthetases class-II family profile domain-containing protein n=1 Tax=Metallococcus carri TaxID=1656884 RepID=A0A967B1J2_9MICO|nr:hypothetical protein [Metallococcus carri]NHN56588.1 hypothetical protein [Metallococcus carri]NOP38887.1 hypothetical protein [Calidifontibacter sp. DB2511S]
MSALADFRAELVERGWLLVDRDGLVAGTGDPLERVVAGLVAAIDDVSAQAGRPVQRVRFAPVTGQQLLEQTGYHTSFPQLIGVVHGLPRDASARRRVPEGEAWDHDFGRSGFGLVPSACHPLYAWLRGTQVTGTAYTLTGDCFRNEPSEDPFRRVSFRMREVVVLGTPAQAREHQRVWRSAGLALYRSLGLQVHDAAANDPFFGRQGAMLANNQRDEQLKFEFVVEPVPGHEVAIGSANYHEDHFGVDFAMTTPDGQPAHSACYGMGLERTALALAATHGFDPGRWPDEVRVALRLS